MYTIQTNRRRLTTCLALLALLYLNPLSSGSALAQEAADEDVGGTAQSEATAAETSEPGDEAEEIDLAEEAEDRAERAAAPAIGTSILGITSLGFGIALLVESGDNADMADQAGIDGDPLRQEELRDRSDRQKVWGGVTTGLGIALIGVATYLWIDWAAEHRAGTDEAPDDDTAFRILPTVDPQGGGALLFTGTF